MQYHIIDLITDAYLNNGWTGLRITPSSANIWDEEWEPGGYNLSNGNKEYATRIRNKNLIPCSPNTTYFGVNIAWILEYDINGTYLGIYKNGYNTTFTTGGNTYFLGLETSSTYGQIYNNDVGINYPSTVTTYEPYAPPTTDIAHRLKLPLPHYFPHPVIDALQRAAAGTQTADDTEILRHYLTPLGIGGI